MMLPALFFIFKSVADRYGSKANPWIVGTQIVLAAGIWTLFAITVEGREEQWPVYLPLPSGLLTAMIIFKPMRESSLSEAGITQPHLS
jgi:ABC-type transport system involved in cytochrome c biogenesis permease subunit